MGTLATSTRDEKGHLNYHKWRDFADAVYGLLATDLRPGMRKCPLLNCREALYSIIKMENGIELKVGDSWFPNLRTAKRPSFKDSIAKKEPRILDWGEVTQQPKPWPFPLGLTLVPVSLSPVSLLREWALTCRYSWHSSFLFDSIASWWEALRKDSHWNYAILFLRRPLLSTLRLRI